MWSRIPIGFGMLNMVIDHVQTPWSHTALEAKGVGEAGTTGAVSTVLNALNDALRPLGATVSELPMTPMRILREVGRL